MNIIYHRKFQEVYIFTGGVFFRLYQPLPIRLSKILFIACLGLIYMVVNNIKKHLFGMTQYIAFDFFGPYWCFLSYEQ